MPSWSPFSPTRRTSGAVISRLMRCDLSSAMSEKLLVSSKKQPCLLRLRLSCQAIGEGLERHGPEIFAAARAHGYRVGLHLFVADHQLVRQFLQAMFPNLKGNLLVSQIRNRPKALI